MQLKQSHIHTWKYLDMEFLKHYQFNLDMASNHIQLQRLPQDINKSFKGYVQIWRELATPVQPPFLEKEMVDLFMDTLSGPYLGRTIGSVSLGFTDPVNVGEHFESGLKSGRIQGASSI